MPKSREVADYLKAHPEFFAEYPDLLAAINQSAAADAVPAHKRIHERQVQALRERNQRQQARFDQLLDTAHSNHDLDFGLHQIAVALLNPDDIDAKDPSAPGRLVKSRFDMDDVAIFLSAKLPAKPPAKKSAQKDGHKTKQQTKQKPAAAQVDYEMLSQRVEHLGSVCDDRVSSQLGTALFPHAAAIASCAFVPITHQQKLYGVMVLGSADRERFQPDMGVLILDRLGQLLGAYLAGRGLVQARPE